MSRCRAFADAARHILSIVRRFTLADPTDRPLAEMTLALWIHGRRALGIERSIMRCSSSRLTSTPPMTATVGSFAARSQSIIAMSPSPRRRLCISATPGGHASSRALRSAPWTTPFWLSFISNRRSRSARRASGVQVLGLDGAIVMTAGSMTTSFDIYLAAFPGSINWLTSVGGLRPRRLLEACWTDDGHPGQVNEKVPHAPVSLGAADTSIHESLDRPCPG